jgi:SNF2 family DNA or RNA helicase
MPFTLHAAWHRANEPFADGKFVFWAETLDFQPTSRTEPAHAGSASRQRQPKPPSHPGQLPIHQLRNLIAEDVPHLTGQEMQPTTTTAWLPTRDGNPVARRSMVQTAGKAVGAPGAAPVAPLTLSCWQITGLTLDPLASLVFLSQLRQQTGNRTAASARNERLRMGNDLLYWSNAAKFALEILIGQHYVPALRMNGGSTLYALWQPALLDDRLKRRFHALAATMPAVCRAYAIDKTADAPTPLALTEHFVATVVDAAVRVWSSTPAVPARRPADDTHGANGAQTAANGMQAGGNGAQAAPYQVLAQPPSGGDTPARQWLRQLRAEGRSLTLPPQPAHKLVQDWQSWIEQLHVTSDANFRIAFELVEPEIAAQSAGYTGTVGESAGETAGEEGAERSNWTLHFALQARDDMRLVIPAAQIWTAYNGVLRYGGRRVDRPQERLLAGLGAASRLFAPIERSLRTPRPELAVLSAAEAHGFLCEIAPLLESNGFGVLLPEWWNSRQRTSLGVRLRLFAEENMLWDGGDDVAADLPSKRRPRGNTPVRYAWELTLGSQRISQEEFEQLAARNVPLLKLHGQWIELDPEQVAAAKRFLAERKATGEMSLLQSIRMAQAYLEQAGDSRTGAVVLDGAALDQETLNGDAAVVTGLVTADVLRNGARTADALRLEAVDVDGWLRGVLEQLRTQKLLAELPEPAGFVGELRPYQRRGLGWLVYLRRLGLGACLADDMGLGKTVQAIAMLLHERAAGLEERRPALLVCPTSVVANWRREVERFAPGLRVLVHHGGSRHEGEAFLQALQGHDIVITSYGTARRDAEVLQQVRWSDLILDEAQNIKNPSAKQSQAVRRFDARNRVALTGTPVENHLTELWSVLEFLNPGYLGSHEQFRQQFTVPIERYNDEEQAAELRRLVQPFLLRRLKSDPTIISDLPEKNEMVVYCSLTQEQASLYETTVHEALANLDRTDGIQRRGLVLSLLTKLKQICNHPSHFLKEPGPLPHRSGKLTRLTEMLEEALSVGDHALVFTQFVEMGTLLQNHLRDCLNTDVLFLHGGTPAAQRDQMVQAFQSEDGPPIFVLSLRAGGSGLNLTRANHVFHFDRWWNPAVENQATDRAFRIGQRRNVQVHKFVVAGTLEERINDIIESKQALAESIVGSGENWLTELDTDQLRELLTLRRETLDD